MLSIKTLLGIVRTEAVMFGGMTEEEYYQRGYHLNPEVWRGDSEDEAHSVDFGLELVRYFDEDGKEKYRWVE